MIITIPGKPIPQGRPRLARNGHCYDPCKQDKKIITEQILTQWQKTWKIERPKISMLFCMPTPKNMNAMIRKNSLCKHFKKPDVDNLAKTYLDCMTGIVYEDDSQVEIGALCKIYAKEPKTIIFIERSFSELWRNDLYHMYGGECDIWSLIEMDSPYDFGSPDQSMPGLFPLKSDPMPPSLASCELSTVQPLIREACPPSIEQLLLESLSVFGFPHQDNIRKEYSD